jgi:glutathione S-transferase
MLTLYHAPRSRSSRFVWLLEELGEPYRIEYVDIRRGDGSGASDARNPHPHKRVPALDHDGAVVWESPAIALYLSDAFPKARLGPQVDDPLRADYVSWLVYYGSVIEPAMTAKMMNWELGGPVGWAAFEDVEARIAERLAHGQQWFLGARFTTLDILIGSLLQWAARLFPDRPEYAAYKVRIDARPALARAQAKDEPARK